MSGILCCIYPFLDSPDVPSWIVGLCSNAFLHEKGFDIYYSGMSIKDVINQQPLFDFVKEAQLAPKAEKNAELLRLDPLLFKSLIDSDALNRIVQAEDNASADLPFKDLYFLLRSKAILVDASAFSYGGLPAEVLYGYLLDIPIFGISHRFLTSPWIINKAVSMFCPRSIDDLVASVYGFLSVRAAMNIVEDAKK